MTDITFRSDMTVELIDSMASDIRVVRAAQVSTLAQRAETRAMSLEGQEKFIQFLMDGRHGSPFEHSVFTFLITAPIFVWREFMRHRIASYNEESSRYKTLEPVFYIPDATRNLKQVGKPGEYDFLPGTMTDYSIMSEGHKHIAEVSYANYEGLLEAGIAREVARITLPGNIYSSAYVTINARSLMNFLSLRTKRPNSAYPSFPQREIEMVAEKMEDHFMELMPSTFHTFERAGRVAP